MRSCIVMTHWTTRAVLPIELCDFESPGSCDMMRLRGGGDVMDTAVQERLEIVRDDLGVARIPLEKDKCVYAVFMCQQAVEKTIKALY